MNVHFATESQSSQDEQAEVLGLQIADDFARTLIETQALEVPTNCGAPVYVITQLEPLAAGPEEFHAGTLADIERAARYLELRGLLHRPLPSTPDCVTFVRIA